MHLSLSPLKQRNSHVRFEQLDLTAQRRLSHAQPRRSFSKMQLFSKNNERSNLPKIDRLGVCAHLISA